MSVSVLGSDLGKNSCSVVGLDATGMVVVRRRMRRECRRSAALYSGNGGLLRCASHGPCVGAARAYHPLDVT